MTHDITDRALELAARHARYNAEMTAVPWQKQGPSNRRIVGDCDHERGPVDIGEFSDEAMNGDAPGVCYLRNVAPAVVAVLRDTIAEIRLLRDRVAELESAAEAGLTTAIAQALTGTEGRIITPEQIHEWVKQLGDPPIEIPAAEHKEPESISDASTGASRMGLVSKLPQGA